MDVLQINDASTSDAFQTSTEYEQDQWIATDAIAAYAAVMAHTSYQTLTLIGKSIGTRAMGHVIAQSLHHPTRCIWLTPLLRHTVVRQQICPFAHPALFVIGTDDPPYDANYVRQVEDATHGQRVIVADANHRLERDGHVIASCQELSRIMVTIEQFLRATHRTV